MIDNFWLLETPPNQRHLKGHADTASEPTACSLNENHRSGYRPTGRLAVYASRSALKDFAWTWASDLLFSQRAFDVFVKHHVTGYEVYPVKVVPRTTEDQAPNFHELVVTGWGGAGAAEAGVRLLESCPGCGRKIYSIAEPNRLIDPKAWDGSDIFMIWPLPKFRFVSDRLARIIRSERLTGAALLPASEIPLERGQKVGPGSLRIWMPADRAHELGDPLGIY